MIPDERDRRIAELERENAHLRARVAEVEKLEKLVAELTAKVAELTERINRNSRNSSKPPSSDPPWSEARAKRRGKLKRGGQPGHAKHTRPVVPPKDVSESFDVKPERCHRCGAALTGDDPAPLLHQVTELPEVKPLVTEYRLHKLRCSRCGAATRASLPSGVPRVAFGPRLTAALGLLTSRCKVSKRGAREFLADVFGIRMALGSVSKQERRLSRAVDPPVAEAAAWIQRQAVANVDETGWREAGKKAWLWVAATLQVAVFAIAPSRGRAVLMRLLGAAWRGVVGSDRFSAYGHLALRQLCWAHLCRDFTAMAERHGPSRAIGRSLLALACWIFRDWYRFRRGAITREVLVERMAPLSQRFIDLLADGTHCSHPQTAATCGEIAAVAEHGFTFVLVEGVDPTNNLAERSLRLGVMWRKQSTGTQSPHGSRFVERMLCCHTTLTLQHRGIYDFLVRAMRADLAHTVPPSLLPAKV